MGEKTYIFAESSGVVPVPRVTTSSTAPSLICQKNGTGYGPMYISFSDENHNVILGVRQNKTDGYKFQDLSQNERVRAKSDAAPSMCFFDKKLYIAWKTDGDTPSISYQRTTDINNKWEWTFPKLVGFNGSDVVVGKNQGPAIGATLTMLYVAWLVQDNSNSVDVNINFSCSTDGVNWSQPKSQNLIINSPTITTIRSHCPPFLLPNGDDMCVYWCAYDPPPSPPPNYKDPVYGTVLDLDDTVDLNHTIIDNDPIGICCVSDGSTQWAFATDPDGTTWVDRLPRVGKQTLPTVRTKKAIAAAFVSNGEICVTWTEETGELKECFFTTTK